MHRWLIASLRWMDVRLLYAFTTLFVIPICLLLIPTIVEQQLTVIFVIVKVLDACVQHGVLILNHCLFSQIVIDRFAVFAGKQFNIEIEVRIFRTVEAETKGFMIFSSHIGCYEVAGYSLISKTKRFNALVFGGEKATVTKGRQKVLVHNNIRMIPVWRI